jgi:signal transduction histidine kinase
VSWFEGLCAIETDLNGVSVGFTGVIRDITARKNAEMINVQQQRRLRKLAAKLASAQDREQQRIAEGLHDEVAQLLTAGSVKLALAQSSEDKGLVHKLLQDIGGLISEANEKVHLLSFELSSSTLHRLGLHAAIRELCEGMGLRYGGRFDVQVAGETSELDESTAIVLFKAVRELLFNVVKHAGVRQATVTISRDDSMLRLEVEDQGAGFSESFHHGRYESGKGLGLFGIQERLRDLGGTMRIESEPDVCTRVILWAPFGGKP